VKEKVRQAKKERSPDVPELKREYEEAIMRAKNKSWETFLSTVSTADDAYIRHRVICKPKSHGGLGPIIKDNLRLTETPEESAEILLKKNFPCMPGHLADPQHNQIIRVADHKLSIPFLSSEPIITDREVGFAIQSGAPKSSAGVDDIPVIVYQQSLPDLTPHLVKIFNQSLFDGVFPEAWKIAKVIFLKKPDKVDYTVPKAYRPISLLSVAGKFFERVIKRRLVYHVSRLNLIDKRQFGFQRGVGAEHAALHLANKITTNFKYKKETIVVFLDVVNAFPSVWHDGLLYKIANMGLPKLYVKWIKSYLENRRAEVDINEGLVVKKSLNRGLPQGAVLSPILWSLFMNDLFKVVSKEGVEIIGFADDVAILVDGGKHDGGMVSKIQRCLNIIEQWGKRWLIKFSPEKTKGILFSKLRKSVNPVLLFEGNEIEFVGSHRYLGLLFDTKLSWSQHIKSRVAMATTSINKLNAVARRRFGLPGLSHKFLYQRAVYFPCCCTVPSCGVGHVPEKVTDDY
jgi:hypothetical protein